MMSHDGVQIHHVLAALGWQDGQLGHSLGRMRYEVMDQLIGLSRVLEARRKRQGTIFLTINFNHIVMVRTLSIHLLDVPCVPQRCCVTHASHSRNRQYSPLTDATPSA